MTMIRQRHDWQKIALPTCLLVNCWTGKGRGLKIADFPYQDETDNSTITMSEDMFAAVGKVFFDH